jgi:hypothetical protein
VKKSLSFLVATIFTTNVIAAPLTEYQVSETIKETFGLLLQASSIPRTSKIDTEFTVVDNTGVDSTIVYEVWPFNGLGVVCNEDSSVFNAVIMAGFGSGVSGASWYYSPVDTLVISGVGYHMKSLNIPVGAKYFYVRFLGATGNGHDTDFQAYLRRLRW